VPAKRRRTTRDERRRTHGQNFLVDTFEIRRLIEYVEIEPDQLVVEIGAGRGALTVPLALRGAKVIAVETDPIWASQLRDRLNESRLGERATVVQEDFRSIDPPDTDFRVISSPPFGLTTELFEHLFDRPTRGPWRADLLIQHEVARKRATTPPTTLRSAAWTPWWEFELGPTVPARAFRPVPRVDAALLTARRRAIALLPEWLAPELRKLLRPGWHPPV
jgi:23S rRNA (adenine-N6)-dimethyltransferase